MFLLNDMIAAAWKRTGYCCMESYFNVVNGWAKLVSSHLRVSYTVKKISERTVTKTRLMMSSESQGINYI